MFCQQPKCASHALWMISIPSREWYACAEHLSQIVATADDDSYAPMHLLLTRQGEPARVVTGTQP